MQGDYLPSRVPLQGLGSRATQGGGDAASQRDDSRCVDAALAWFNASADGAEDEFKVTGILDADQALNGPDKPRLILCGGDR